MHGQAPKALAPKAPAPKPEEFKIRLPLNEGLARLSRCDPNKFTFVVGNEEFTCVRSQACFLSPKVCELLECDNAADRMEVDVSSNFSFELFIRLAMGEEVSLDREGVIYARSVAAKLGNRQLSDLLLTHKMWEEKLSPESVIDMLQMKMDYKQSAEKEITYIAENLCTFEVEQLEKIQIDELEMVLNSDRLKVEDENWLLDFILKRAEEDSTFKPLLGYVRLEFLDKEHTETYLDAAYVSMNPMIWNSLSRYIRMASRVSPEWAREFVLHALPHRKELTEETGDVFTYLNNVCQKLCGCDPYKLGLVTGNCMTSINCSYDMGWLFTEHRSYSGEERFGATIEFNYGLRVIPTATEFKAYMSLGYDPYYQRSTSGNMTMGGITPSGESKGLGSTQHSNDGSRESKAKHTYFPEGYTKFWIGRSGGARRSSISAIRVYGILVNDGFD